MASALWIGGHHRETVSRTALTTVNFSGFDETDRRDCRETRRRRRARQQEADIPEGKARSDCGSSAPARRLTAVNASAAPAPYSAETRSRGVLIMPWNTIVAALLVLAAVFSALGLSLGLALLLGGTRWPEAQSDGLRWSGAVSAPAMAPRLRQSHPGKIPIRPGRLL